MIDKKSLTKSILNNIGDNKFQSFKSGDKKNNSNNEDFQYEVISKKSETQNLIDASEVKLDLNSFVMVPINHPNINEIIKLLNNSINENSINENRSSNNLSKDNEIKKTIIILNDILNLNQKKLIIPTNSIITPMARDYIKQKEIKITYEEDK